MWNVLGFHSAGHIIRKTSFADWPSANVSWTASTFSLKGNNIKWYLHRNVSWSAVNTIQTQCCTQKRGSLISMQGFHTQILSCSYWENEDSQTSRAGGQVTQALEKTVLTDKPGGVEKVHCDHCSPSCSGAHLSGTSLPPNDPPYMTGEKGNNITIVDVVQSRTLMIGMLTEL